jgi:putative restriction endonuclease
MHRPPDDVQVGDRLTQDEIEERFDTGFGYRISGINPRRDNNDNRYLLVFANEDGPYDDSVTQGRFEYIGEGLEGDQSEDSPGNSALIDAVSSDFPVYFFYAETDRPEWEFQGEVDVLGYQPEERGGRQVLVFDMEHQEDESEKTGGEINWLTAMRLELERYREERAEDTVTLHEIYDFSESRLAKQFPENDNIRAKIRQLLQRLRDRGEVEFLDDEGTYQIREIQLENSTGLSLPVETDDTESVDTHTPGLYLIPVNDDWLERFRNSVEEPHNLQQYGDVPPQIEGIDRLRIWGTTETDGDKKQSAIDQMSPHDCLLFYHAGDFFAGGTVGRTFENPDVGEMLWNNPESRYLFTVENFTHSVPTIEVVWDMLGYEGRQVVQGFSRVADERVSNIREEHGSIDSLILESDSGEPSQKEIEEEKSELAQAVESEPELTEDDTEFVETRRKARNSAFRELVRDTYNNTCAVCGSQRKSPDGNPEVEAAHIYPHSKGGSDDIRNGIALCKSHHWAFDSGWIAFTNDHEIIVADAPEKSGFHELKQLEGQSLRLPDNEDAHPHPMFLEQHREIQGFD